MTPVITAYLERSNVARVYFDPRGTKASLPELSIAAGIVHFLKLHYAFDVPRYPKDDGNVSHVDSHSKCGFADALYETMGLPTSHELLQVWKQKRPKMVNYLHLTTAPTLAWDELPDYLAFCEAGGVTIRKETQLKLRPGSYDELYVYAAARPPVRWAQVELTDAQRKELANLRKSWTECVDMHEYEETVVPAYQLLLTVVATVLSVPYPELLRRVCVDFEHKWEFYHQ